MDRASLIAALRSREYADGLHELHQALGVVACIVDLDTGETLSSGGLPAPCALGAHGAERLGAACITGAEADLASRPASPVRAVCDAGMSCVVAPVRQEGRIVCHALVSGFFSAESERERMVQRALASGAEEAAVRDALASTPVLSVERVDALVSLVVRGAELILSSLRDERRRVSREQDVRVLSRVAEEFVSRSTVFDRVPEGALDALLALTGAAGARIALMSPDGTLDDVAEAGDTGALDAARAMVGDVVSTGRTMVSTQGGGPRPVFAGVVAPLRAAGAVRGVLTVAESGAEPVTADDLRLVELFANVVSVMLLNTDGLADANTKLVELIQVNEVAKVLNATLDYAPLADLAIRVLGKTLDFEVGGFVIDGFGERRGRVIHSSDVTEADLARIVADASGAETTLEGITVTAQDARRSAAAGSAAAEWTVLSHELRFRNVRAGVVFVAAAGPGPYREHDSRVLDALAAHLSVALENATVYERLRRDFDRTIAALSALADASERRDRGHTDRVMDYAVAIGEEMGLPRESIEELRIAGLLHDVGMTGVAEEIIIKPSALTDSEYERLRRHSEMGAEILEQIRFLDAITPIVRHHHERWDGGGYPDGLAGEAIPLGSRVLAVADAFESMTAGRSHRRRMPAATARIEVARASGTQFDPAVVEAFLGLTERLIASASTGLFAGESGLGAGTLPS